VLPMGIIVAAADSWCASVLLGDDPKSTVIEVIVYSTRPFRGHKKLGVSLRSVKTFGDIPSFFTHPDSSS
jgi:hypothetical protein